MWASILALLTAASAALVRVSKLLSKPPIDRKLERKLKADDEFEKAKQTHRPSPDDWRGR